MTDLTERLRSRAKYAHTTCWCESELTEAADEIERLRAALQNVMAYGLESHGLSDPGILLMIWSIADKALREADDGH
jgi:hypothetical protein